MKALEKSFDKYSFNTRVKAAFWLVFPVVLSVVVLFEPSRSLGGIVLTFVTSFGVISFAASQMSTKGNILQERLFKKWGGAPTTLILQHSDSRLDTHTKARYMLHLQKMVPNFKLVTYKEELDSPATANEMYKSAATFLREHTRDVTQYPLVFQENISYGFSRNVMAFKWLGVIVSILSLTISSFIVWFKYFMGKSDSLLVMLFSVPFENISLIVILFSILLVWIFSVTEKWVEIRAFAYARALLAACEYKS